MNTSSVNDIRKRKPESQKSGLLAFPLAWNLAFGTESDKATKDGACDWRCGEGSLWNSSPLIRLPVSSTPYFCYAALSAHFQAEEHGDAQSDAKDDRKRRRVTAPHENELDLKKRQRLHALSLAASGQAHHRHEIAAMLGVHRHSVAAWFRAYAQGGLDHTLRYQRPIPPRHQRITATALTVLQETLQDPHGFAGYHQIRLW